MTGWESILRALVVRWPRLLMAGLALGLVACATPPTLQTPTGPVPDLRGTWTGTWGTSPLTVLIVDQQEGIDSSVALGPWPVLGRPLFALTGMMTFSVAGRLTSTNLRGRLGRVGHGLTLILEPQTANGEWLELHLIDERHATGIGHSQFRPDASGAVELWRQPGRP